MDLGRAKAKAVIGRPTTTIRILACFAAIYLAGSGESSAQTPPQNMRIAYSSSGINYADLFLAKEKGYFREEGLEPQFIQMSSSIAITAGIAGEVDGQASVGSAIRPSIARSKI